MPRMKKVHERVPARPVAQIGNKLSCIICVGAHTLQAGEWTHLGEIAVVAEMGTFLIKRVNTLNQERPHYSLFRNVLLCFLRYYDLSLPHSFQ